MKQPTRKNLEEFLTAIGFEDIEHVDEVHAGFTSITVKRTRREGDRTISSRETVKFPDPRKW